MHYEKTTTKKIYAEAIVDFLVEKKLTHVFDLTGGMIAYLEDAISRKEGIECVPMHHEQAAGFAAEGYARMGQNFGVAIATSGPGAMNLMTAIGSCYFDSIPTLFITGQVHTDNIKKNNLVRQEGFQETDVVSIVKNITKYAVLVTNPDMIIYELEKAYYSMKRGRLGPVLVDIPINLQRTEVDFKMSKHFFGSKEHRQLEKEDAKFTKKIESKKVNELQALLKKSKAPLVVVGHGIQLSKTPQEIDLFVKNNNIPVVSSLMGLDALPQTNKLHIGYIGSNGNRNANIVFANADLIIALGTRLDIRQTGDPKFFNRSATIVHVDIDKSSINYAIKSKLSFETDLSTFFESTKKLATPPKPKWFTFIASVSKNFGRVLPYTKGVHPNVFIRELSLLSPRNATIVVDVGQNQQWCAQSWVVKPGQRLLFSGGMGAMGFALPAAIGAWCANRKSNIIVISGDGGIQINVQELETASRNGIPMKLFVMNNKSLGMVREFQDLYFNKNYQSTVTGYGYPDFKKLADAYNFDYVSVTSVKKSDPQLKDVLSRRRPTLIEVDLPINATLQPKIVYGHALDDQAPYLSQEQKELLEQLKADLRAS
jgi:acetolactate synthase-1/2/3 large subunit